MIQYQTRIANRTHLIPFVNVTNDVVLIHSKLTNIMINIEEMFRNLLNTLNDENISEIISLISDAFLRIKRGQATVYDISYLQDDAELKHEKIFIKEVLSNQIRGIKIDGSEIAIINLSDIVSIKGIQSEISQFCKNNYSYFFTISGFLEMVSAIILGNEKLYLTTKKNELFLLEKIHEAKENSLVTTSGKTYLDKTGKAHGEGGIFSRFDLSLDDIVSCAKRTDSNNQSYYTEQTKSFHFAIRTISEETLRR